MNAEPVLIDDDDVDMEPVVIIDEDNDKIYSKRVDFPSVETIVLDDDPVSGVQTVNNDTAIIDYKNTIDKSEVAFVNNLRNNRLMDKIVTTCINMENAVGMPRVIYKTLLPLYSDTNNKFKESERFKTLLKKTLKLLIRDPDHKFLHIKRLCEELKSGGLRRKVPFITLATDLKKNSSQWGDTELNSSSREINENREENKQIHEVNKTNNTTKKRGSKRKAKQSNTCSTVIKKRRKQTKSITITENNKTDVIDLDNSDNEYADRLKSDNSQNDVIVIDETETGNRNDNSNKVSQEEIIEEDSNKENNVTESRNNNLPNDEKDLELLIPQNHIEVMIEGESPYNPNADLERIADIEKHISFYKRMIAKLEEAEVTSDSTLSPYIQCSKLKEKIVQCYKQICEINGYSEDIVKRREIRLHVADGHPPGPAKTLERFLNSTIDTTGAVTFPDFADVVKCVFEANAADSLGWSRQQVFQEAAALFRHCGQALRKRRQKREYRDLLSLVRDKEVTDDPAENDPFLQAKLEENKLIAKIKEEEILEKYVNMENNRSSREVINHGQNTVEFESENDSSGSDGENEQNVALRNATTAIVHKECDTTKSSITNSTSNNLDLSTNSVIVTPTEINNQCDIEITKSNDINNTVDVTMSAVPSTRNPILTHLLKAPERLPHHINTAIRNDNQYAIGESSKNNNDTDMLPINTIKTLHTTHNEKKTLECSETEGNNSNLDLRQTGTTNVISTVNGYCRPSAIDGNHVKGVENPDVTANNESNLNDTQNSDSNIIKTVVKLENNVESEPLDIQCMLDELGDGFVCTVFDIEDPFLVIEISSDSFSDDEF